jgi:hypothetical protein
VEPGAGRSGITGAGNFPAAADPATGSIFELTGAGAGTLSGLCQLRTLGYRAEKLKILWISAGFSLTKNVKFVTIYSRDFVPIFD